MMKILIVISILQIGAILLLYGKLAGMEQSISRPAPAQSVSTSAANPFQSQAPVADPGASVDEVRLRQIIREELASQLGQQAQSGADVIAGGMQEQGNLAVNERQREQVFQQLEYFKSVGRISESDMHELQADIAKLDAASRTAALRELTKALNSGRLEGRL